MLTARTRACLAVLLFLLLLAGIGVLVFGNHTEDSFDADIRGIQECQTQKTPLVCSIQFVKHMLTYLSAAQIMERISTTLPANQCHFEGHVVGQQLYIQTGSVETALSECSRGCDSSCVHGVVGEAFADELGYGAGSDSKGFDFSHLNENQVIELGARLCQSTETCHGIGHVIFQTTKDIGKGMRICDLITVRQNQADSCYFGVTMEFADILGSTNIRETAGVMHPKISSLPTLCIFKSNRQRRACFRYLTRYAVGVMAPLGYTGEQAVARMREICESLPRGDDRISCMAGVGVHQNHLVTTDPEAARRICDTSQLRMDKAACVLGQIYVSAEYHYEAIAKYCATFPDEVLKKSCYQNLFHSLYLSNFNMGDARALCAEGDDVCKEALGNYKFDSRTLIQAL